MKKRLLLIPLVALLLVIAGILSSQTAINSPTNPNLLGKLTSANFNVTTDQPIVINSPKYLIRRITVTNCSLSLSLAAGGFYSSTAKGGTLIVAATQIYSGLTANTKYIDTTLALTTDSLTANPIYLSLTTAQGSPSTCDVYVYGDTIS